MIRLTRETTVTYSLDITRAQALDMLEAAGEAVDTTMDDAQLSRALAGLANDNSELSESMDDYTVETDGGGGDWASAAGIEPFPGDHDCPGEWKLMEGGYVRTWSIEVDPAALSLTAFYGGSEDFSESGDGHMVLVCSTCLEERAIPEGWEVDYQ